MNNKIIRQGMVMNYLITSVMITIFMHFSCEPSCQSVNFFESTGLLNPIAGFTAYADCVVDMDGDYLDDVVRVGGKGVFIDYQQKDGSFFQRQFNFPLQSLPSWSVCAGDLDNNGHNDLLFAHSSSVSFIMANANGTNYVERLMPDLIESQRSTIADINNDGWVDAFVCNESSVSIPFRNQGNGMMIKDTNLIHTSSLPGNYAAIWTDYDNDRDIDLYISKCLDGTLPGDPIRTNLLYRNNNDGTFTETGALAGIDDNAQSWSTSFEDFDNDGDFDAFVVNHDFANRLYRNNGDGTFTDVITDSGIDLFDLQAFENASGDFNNDGFMDIFAELTLRIYLGHGDLTFTGQEAPVKPGTVGDLNDDGFLDLMHENKAWINEGNTNHWLKINTLGLVGNRNGIGARIEIFGNWGRQMREVRSGQSYSPMSSLTTHFGLGSADKVDSLIVSWPSGIISKWTNLIADTTYLVAEASCHLPSMNLDITGTISLCPGDSILIQAPVGFENYLWSYGDTTQVTTIDKEGIYYLIAKDSMDCVSVSDFFKVEMREDRVPVITAGSGIRFCEGDSITLTSSPGLNYSWSTGELLVQSIQVHQSGSYTVAVDAACADGQIVSNPLDVLVLPAPSPDVSDVFLLPGDSILLMATGDNIQWYDQPVGGILLGTGPSLQTSSLASSTIYYAESHHHFPAIMQSGGKADTIGAGGMPLQDGYLFFETWEPFTLVSVTVYLPQGGPQGIRFVQLHSNDSLIGSKQFIVHEGMNLLELNFDVPVGKHFLTCPQGNLFRNTGPLNYPYTIGDAGRITRSSNGENYYYYFYDWKISKPEIECISERVPLHVIVTSSETIKDQMNIKIYPNPASDVLYIRFEDRVLPIGMTMFDVFGKQVYRKTIGENKLVEINIRDFIPGMYHLQFIRDGKSYSGRIILQ